MRELISVKTVEEIRGYEAVDGTQFTSKEECEKYEKTAKCIVKERFRKLVTHSKTINELTEYGTNPLTEESDDCEIGIVRLNTSDDVRNANMYMEMVAQSQQRFTEDMIGKDIVCFLGCCGDSWTIIYGTIDECVEKYREGLIKIYEKENEAADD